MRNLLCILTLLLATCAVAQNTHTITLNWTNPSVTGSQVLSSNNVYSGATCSTMTKVYASSGVITSYELTGLPPNTTYCLAVTAVCNVCTPSESAQSNTQTVTTQGAPQINPPVLGTPTVTELFDFDKYLASHTTYNDEEAFITYIPTITPNDLVYRTERQGLSAVSH